MKIQQTKAFTLVELIIVITILVILRTIGFMSFQTYTIDARDGKRKTDLSEVRKGLEIYQTKNGILPTPDSQIVNIMSGTNVISYQGYLGTNVLKNIRATSDIKDSKDNNYYTYSTNGTKTKYQLLTMLENQNNLAINNNQLIKETYARIDYTTRYAYTTGNKVGIFFSGSTNETPIQETMSGNLDLTTGANATKVFKVMFTNQTTNSGTLTITGANLPQIIQTETNSTASIQTEIPVEITYAISACPTVNRARNRTTPTRATILANINDYIGCTVAGYTGVIGGYTYSGSIIPANKMIMIVETNNTARAGITQWGLYGTDLGTLANITASTNTTTMTNDIVSWDGLSNTQKILVGLTRAGETGRAAQLCNAKGTGIRYLPATEELNQLYCYNNNDATNDGNYGAGPNNADCVNKGYIAQNKNTLSNFVADYYWSSTEYNANYSRIQGFGGGDRVVNSKNRAVAVRCLSRF